MKALQVVKTYMCLVEFLLTTLVLSTYNAVILDTTNCDMFLVIGTVYGWYTVICCNEKHRHCFHVTTY